MKILKISVLIAFLGIFSSCTDEFDGGVILQETTDVTGTLVLLEDHFGSGQSTTFSFTLPQSFSKKAIVTVEALSAEFVRTLSTVEIDAGATTGNGAITMPETTNLGGYNLTLDFVDVKIIGITLLDEVEAELVPSLDDTYILTSNEVSVSYYNLLPNKSGSGNFSYLLDWDDVSIDIDLEAIDAAFTKIFESSGSGSRYESDFFDNAHPDGDYDFYFRIWDGSDPTIKDIAYRFFTVQPDGTRRVYEGVIPAGSPTGGARIDFATLTASGDDYTFVID